VRVSSAAHAADGTLALEEIRGAVRDPRNVHNAAPGVICLENTHNRSGGAVLSLEYMKRVRALADELRLPMHLDGARLANAAVALKLPVKALAEPFESVQFDLSKGLGAPVGGIRRGICSIHRTGRSDTESSWAAGCARRASSRQRESLRSR
jgi:threonine aldolase